MLKKKIRKEKNAGQNITQNSIDMLLLPFQIENGHNLEYVLHAVSVHVRNRQFKVIYWRIKRFVCDTCWQNGTYASSSVYINYIRNKATSVNLI